MKMLIAALALSAAIATPALAQSFDSDYGTGNVTPFAYVPQTDNHGYGAMAQSYTTRDWGHRQYRHRPSHYRIKR